MCYNCGCHIPDYDMGNPENITDETFQDLANHWKLSGDETRKKVFAILKKDKESKTQIFGEDDFLKERFEKAAYAWGQSVDEAINNTLDLLKTKS